jgi:hypothetical protein
LPFSFPNLAHFRRSATVWSTMLFCSVRLLRRVIYAFISILLFALKKRWERTKAWGTP